MENTYKLTTPKTITTIFVYFLLFLAGDLFGSLPFDFVFSFITLPCSELYIILRMLGCFILTFALFWLYTTKRLHLKLSDFGITCRMKSWGIGLSVLLPAVVIVGFLMAGVKLEANEFSFGRTLLIIMSSAMIALKSGILEEMLFRGFIMKLLESRWNKYVAIFVPSFIFGLVHIPSMETFTVEGVMLLIVSGTLVGIMFSLAAYAGKSVANSMLLHGMWNFVMITDILHITTKEGIYGEPLFSMIISSDNILLTGAGFGMEASIIAIAGYALICILAGAIWKRKSS
ncbi:MAG: type II CAAX endopeptidase family protein [Eubacteriales bacterium]|nr:type II CAAX endopeptidase family protein [Eubacteriales bacterium]